MRRLMLAFVAGIIVMAAGGYAWLHRAPLTPEGEPETRKERRLDRTTTTIAVGEVVNEIRQLDRLIVFQAYVTAITTTHDVGWLTQSDQTMITPAFVNYYLDMATLPERAITVRDGMVTILRPAILIERPNIDTLHTQTFNDGVWSTLSSTADRLRIANNRMAVDQLRNRAKMPFLAKAARDAAAAALAANVGSVLARAGHSGLKVRVVS